MIGDYAAVGSVTSCAIGSCNPSKQSYNGLQMHKALSELGPAAPSTFAHTGPGHTWSSKTTLHRNRTIRYIDHRKYILKSKGAFTFALEAAIGAIVAVASTILSIIVEVQQLKVFSFQEHIDAPVFVTQETLSQYVDDGGTPVRDVVVSGQLISGVLSTSDSVLPSAEIPCVASHCGRQEVCIVPHDPTFLNCHVCNAITVCTCQIRNRVTCTAHLCPPGEHEDICLECYKADSKATTEIGVAHFGDSTGICGLGHCPEALFLELTGTQNLDKHFEAIVIGEHEFRQNALTTTAVATDLGFCSPCNAAAPPDFRFARCFVLVHVLNMERVSTVSANSVGSLCVCNVSLWRIITYVTFLINLAQR